MDAPSLYTWAGSLPVFEKLFDQFYEKVQADALLGPVFAHMSPAHSRHVAHFVAEVFGGPKLYSQNKPGAHAHMIGKHLGKMLTEPMRQQWVHLLLQTADEVGLKTDPEFRSALVGYLEWGSRIAVMNSAETENPLATDVPMPTWGWGETGGPYQP